MNEDASNPKPARQALSDEPRADGRRGGLIAGIFFFSLIGFGALARVDAAVYAPGIVEVVGSAQQVQHPEGGVVSALNVREGEQVVAGQVLLELGSPQAVAEESALTAQYLGLVARRARVSAELDGTQIAPPAEFAALGGPAAEAASLALGREAAELAARRSALANERAIYRQQKEQLSRQIDGYNRQIEANAAQKRLIEEELEGMRELASRGFASQNTVRQLERSVAALGGQQGEHEAGAARALEAIGQTDLEIAGLGDRSRQELAESLRATETEIAGLRPRLDAARERLAATQVRSPATGKVVGLSVFTVGGVIGAGEALMEVVPDATGLVIVARVSPDDADDIAEGQVTEIRFPGLRQGALPKITGKVVEVSADSFVDEQTGARFFRAEVEAPPQEWRKLGGEDSALGLKPGLPAEIIVPLRKRTALQYLVEPLQQRLWRSFREH